MQFSETFTNPTWSNRIHAAALEIDIRHSALSPVLNAELRAIVLSTIGFREVKYKKFPTPYWGNSESVYERSRIIPVNKDGQNVAQLLYMRMLLEVSRWYTRMYRSAFYVTGSVSYGYCSFPFLTEDKEPSDVDLRIPYDQPHTRLGLQMNTYLMFQGLPFDLAVSTDLPDVRAIIHSNLLMPGEQNEPLTDIEEWWNRQTDTPTERYR